MPPKKDAGEIRIRIGKHDQRRIAVIMRSDVYQSVSHMVRLAIYDLYLKVERENHGSKEAK